MPHLYTILVHFLKTKHSKQILVVGEENQDMEDKIFWNRCMREAGINITLKGYEKDNYRLEVVSKRKISTFD